MRDINKEDVERLRQEYEEKCDFLLGNGWTEGYFRDYINAIFFREYYADSFAIPFEERQSREDLIWRRSNSAPICVERNMRNPLKQRRKVANLVQCLSWPLIILGMRNGGIIRWLSGGPTKVSNTISSCGRKTLSISSRIGSSP